MTDKLRRLRATIDRASGPLTALGRTVVICGVVAWIGAWLLGWEELAIAAGASVAAIVLAALFTIGRTDLRIDTVITPSRVVVGERAVGELTVTNAAKRRMLPVRLELPVGTDVAVIDVPSLAGGHAFEETIVVPTSRRAVIPVGPTRSVRGDPLGLMRREVTWSDELELFVHPLTTNLNSLTSGWLRDLEGRPTNDRSPNDVAFHTLREYVPGDDRRHVHWRTSARLGELMVRQFIDNRRSHLGIVIDTDLGNYADEDELELAISMAGSLGLKAIADGQETSCIAGPVGVPAHNGQALLDGLSRVEVDESATDLAHTALRAAPALADASVIAVVTGSAIGLAKVQVAAQRFGVDPAVIALRADRAGQPGVQRTPRLVSITAPSLDTLARAIWAVSNS